MTPRTWTLGGASQAALDALRANSLSAVLETFLDVFRWMTTPTTQRGLGLDAPTARTHPISRLFAEATGILTGAGPGEPLSYHTAYMACTHAARTPAVNADLDDPRR